MVRIINTSDLDLEFDTGGVDGAVFSKERHEVSNHQIDFTPTKEVSGRSILKKKKERHNAEENEE